VSIDASRLLDIRSCCDIDTPSMDDECAMYRNKGKITLEEEETKYEFA
jgi:hypothetical protein